MHGCVFHQIGTDMTDEIKWTGEVTYPTTGENYQPGEAAEIFWKAVTYNMPTPTLEELAGRTPWAVICIDHGKQYLTGEQYDDQMMECDSRWFCPVCGGQSEWDDDNFEAEF